MNKAITPELANKKLIILVKTNSIILGMAFWIHSLLCWIYDVSHRHKE